MTAGWSAWSAQVGSHCVTVSNDAFGFVAAELGILFVCLLLELFHHPVSRALLSRTQRLKWRGDRDKESQDRGRPAGGAFMASAELSEPLIADE